MAEDCLVARVRIPEDDDALFVEGSVEDGVTTNDEFEVFATEAVFVDLSVELATTSAVELLLAVLLLVPLMPLVVAAPEKLDCKRCLLLRASAASSKSAKHVEGPLQGGV
jgi:hypothetical protein